MSASRQFDQSAGRYFVQSQGRQRNRIAGDRGVVITASVPFRGFPQLNIYDADVLYGEANPIFPGYPVLLDGYIYTPSVITRYLKVVQRITYGEGGAFQGWVESTTEYSPKYGDVVYHKVENSCVGIKSESTLSEENVLTTSGNGLVSACDSIPVAAPAYSLAAESYTEAENEHLLYESGTPDYFWQRDTTLSIPHTRQDVESLARGLLGHFDTDSFVRLSTPDCAAGLGERVWLGLDANGSARRISGLFLAYARGCEGNMQRTEMEFTGMVSANIWQGGTWQTSGASGSWFGCLNSTCNSSYMAKGKFRSGAAYASISTARDERFDREQAATCGLNYAGGVTTTFPIPDDGSVRFTIKPGSCPPTS